MRRASLEYSAFLQLSLFLCVLIASPVGADPVALQTSTPAPRPRVCTNEALREAIRIIERACDEITCKVSTLRELDTRVPKEALLSAFEERELKSVHVFFPMNIFKLEESFDWNTTKKSQLGTLAYLSDPDNSVIFILGRASIVGDPDYNQRLSRERMRGVMEYLKSLGVRCHSFRGAWFGREILQLTKSDAELVRIERRDYRDDPLILNQSVHVFVFPCADLL